MLVAVKCTEDGELKDKLIDDIFHLKEADAYTRIDESLNKLLSTNYNFREEQMRETTKMNLKREPINKLRLAKDRALKCIHCTFAFAAKYMVEKFKKFVDQINRMTLENNDKDSLLVRFGYVASASAKVWRKAISALISIDVEPGQWLWRMLIFTNTLPKVTRKSYPGMTRRDEDVFKRISLVLAPLLSNLKHFTNDCPLENEQVWDLKMPNDDKTDYGKNIFKAYYLECPRSEHANDDLQQLCDHYEYVENFDKLLYRNRMKKQFSYDKYERFDPDKWLVTYGSLKKTLVGGEMSNSDLEDIENKLTVNVKPISNQDWVLQYSSKYFETISDMSEKVLRITLQHLNRTFILCKYYWEPNKIVIGHQKLPFDFKNECTGIQAPIGMIMKKFNLDENEILQTLYKLSTRKIFTSNVEYQLIIKYIIVDFDKDIVKIKSDGTNGNPSILEITKSYMKEFKTYSDGLPDIYNEEFILFKKSFYKPSTSNTIANYIN